MSAEFTPRFPSMDEVSRLTAQANAMRARAVVDLVARAASGLKTLFASVLEGRDNARVFAELQAMDDRLLHDIGITRGDIIAVANGLKSERDVANENRAALTSLAPRPAA